MYRAGKFQIRKKIRQRRRFENKAPIARPSTSPELMLNAGLPKQCLLQHQMQFQGIFQPDEISII